MCVFTSICTSIHTYINNTKVSQQNKKRIHTETCTRQRPATCDPEAQNVTEKRT